MYLNAFSFRCLCSVLLFFGCHITAVAAVQTLNNFGSNTQNPSYGSADQMLQWKQVPPRDRTVDDVGQTDNAALPSARQISNQLSDSQELLHSTTGFSDTLPTWGMLIQMDILNTEERDAGRPFNIQVPAGDNEFDASSTGTSQIPFLASVRNPVTTAPTGFVQVKNLETSVIDCSWLYGTTEAAQSAIRSFQGGLLVSRNTSVGEFPPKLSSGLYAFGNGKVNMVPTMTALAIVLFREHNRKARIVQEESSAFTDEEIFQRSRRWVISIVQKITFDEYLPSLLGEQMPPFQGFDPNANPDIDIFFSSVGYRFGHSMTNSLIMRLDENGDAIQQGHLLLHESLYKVDSLEALGIEPIIRGTVYQQKQRVDLRYVEELRSLLKINSPQGYDLKAATIQRCRELGMPKYNEARKALGLTEATTWSDVSSDAQVQQALQTLYNDDINQLEAFVGALAEDHSNGGAVGPLMKASIVEQFNRIRAGDNYFYYVYLGFTEDEINNLLQISLASLIRLDTSIQPSTVPGNVFQVNHIVVEPVCEAVDVVDVDPVKIYVFDEKFVIEYILNTDENIVEFTITTLYSGWIAFGFGSSMSDLKNINMIYKGQDGVWVQGNAYSDKVGLVKFYDKNDDTVETFREVASTELDSPTVFVYKRPIVVGKDNFVDILDKDMNIAFAASNDPFPAYHEIRDVHRINLFSPNKSSSLPVLDESMKLVLIVHGVIMILLFGIMYPIGVFVARYYRDLGNWLAIHQILMASIVTSTIVSAMVAVAFGFGVNVKQTHAKLGYSIMAIIITVAVAGIRSSNITNHKANKLLYFVRYYHKLGGFTVFVLGTMNIVLGSADLAPYIGLDRNAAWLTLFLPCTSCLMGWLYAKHQNKLAANDDRYFKKDAHLPEYTWAGFNERISMGEVWIVVDDKIYDCGKFIGKHPGGRAAIVSVIGLDASIYFHHSPEEVKLIRRPFYNAPVAHKHTRLAQNFLESMIVGTITQLVPLKESKAKSKDGNSIRGKESMPITDGNVSPSGSDKEFERVRRRSSTVERLTLGMRRLGNNSTTIEEGLPQRESTEFTPFANKFYMLGLKTRRLVTKSGARNRVYRLVFQLDDPLQTLRIAPGNSVLFQFIDDDRVVVNRYYTAVNFINKGEIEFYVKVYSPGEMSQHLENCSFIRMAFKQYPDVIIDQYASQLNKVGYWKQVGLVCGGTGLTLMLNIIQHHLHYILKLPNHERVNYSISLLSVNHSPDDVFGLERLKELWKISKGVVTVKQLVKKRENDEQGFTQGELTKDLLVKRMPTPDPGDTVIFLCGPGGFMDKVKGMLLEEQYPEEMIKVADAS